MDEKNDKKNEYEFIIKYDNFSNNSEPQNPKDDFYSTEISNIHSIIEQIDPEYKNYKILSLDSNSREKIKYNLPDYWLFKVIGLNKESFSQKIFDFLSSKKLKKTPDYKYSKNKKYISYTFEIFVKNKEELYEFYKILKSFEETKFCL